MHDSTRVVDLGSSIKAALARFRNSDFRLLGTLLSALAIFAAILLAFVLLLYVLSTARERLSRIPILIQIVSWSIIALASFLIKMMLAERARVLNAYTTFVTLVRPLPSVMLNRANGLDSETLIALQKRSQNLRGLSREWWRLLEGSLEVYQTPDGHNGYFALRPVQEILDQNTLVWAVYQISFYQAIPGILTALGLLATFIAILQGLAGVSYNPQDLRHPVSGIDSLINGLSGKFITSIVALVMSIVFTFIEKRLCERSILLAYDRLVSRFQDVIPYLSQSRILLDLQTVMVRRLASTRAEIEEREWER